MTPTPRRRRLRPRRHPDRGRQRLSLAARRRRRRAAVRARRSRLAVALAVGRDSLGPRGRRRQGAALRRAARRTRPRRGRRARRATFASSTCAEARARRGRRAPRVAPRRAATTSSSSRRRPRSTSTSGRRGPRRARRGWRTRLAVDAAGRAHRPLRRARTAGATRRCAGSSEWIAERGDTRRDRSLYAYGNSRGDRRLLGAARRTPSTSARLGRARRAAAVPAPGATAPTRTSRLTDRRAAELDDARPRARRR